MYHCRMSYRKLREENYFQQIRFQFYILLVLKKVVLENLEVYLSTILKENCSEDSRSYEIILLIFSIIVVNLVITFKDSIH